MASKNVAEFTDENFENDVLKSGTPVLVDFWAEWCGPCRMIAPMIDKVADEYVGRIKVGKVDTEASRDIAIKYRISNIPTLILFKDGQETQRFVGIPREQPFREALNLLGGAAVKQA
jgi:thioredoxin 1